MPFFPRLCEKDKTHDYDMHAACIFPLNNHSLVKTSTDVRKDYKQKSAALEGNGFHYGATGQVISFTTRTPTFWVMFWLFMWVKS